MRMRRVYTLRSLTIDGEFAMQNYRITVQYDGTKYNGWQRQGNAHNTIQERFENVLSKMCGTKIEIFASGRTDAGVHAQGQVANFKCETDMCCDEICEYLNHYLPEDIRVIGIEEVDERFHSRLCAKSKTYEYCIATEKPDVFVRKYVYFTDEKVDISRMKQAAELFLGTHDFHGFSSVGKTKKSTVRTINTIDITSDKGIIKITVNGNGFLYNMVRIMVGTLYEIGTGKKDESLIVSIFENKKRSQAGITMPARGLKLLQVLY